MSVSPWLWSEFKHANAAGVAYSSKLDDFAAFVSRASRYSQLTLSSSSSAAASSSNPRVPPGAPSSFQQPSPAVPQGQGLTLVHFSAQPEPFLTQIHTP